MSQNPPALSVGSAARRLGVAASTLRSWDRRYGMSPSGRSAGQHRRYDAEDLARLRIMHRLILDGAPAAEAARTALGTDLDEPGTGPDRRDAPPPGPVRPRQAGTTQAAGSVPRDPSAEVEMLWRATLAMDDRAMSRLVRDALRRHGVVRAWDDLLVPVLIRIGDRQSAGADQIEVEHLLSGCVLAALSAVSARLGDAVNARPVLLACAEEEQHSLPIYALQAALAKQHIRSRMLGARVPSRSLAAAIRRLAPGVVFVWSQAPQTGDLATLATLPSLRPPTRLIVGGPGWRPAEPVPALEMARSLPDALLLVRSALGLD
jgi:MerR family transcriptional regulator, light-induced transcriptional regulator